MHKHCVLIIDAYKGLYMKSVYIVGVSRPRYARIMPTIRTYHAHDTLVSRP